MNRVVRQQKTLALLQWKKVSQHHPDHSNTLTSVNNLALLFYAQDKLNEAEPLFRRELEGRERTLGPDHKTTLISVNNLKKQNYGRIVNIASVAGKEGNAGMLAYSVSKAAVIGLTKVIGKEYAETGNNHLFFSMISFKISS